MALPQLSCTRLQLIVNKMTNLELVEALRQNYIAYFQLFHGQHGIHVQVDKKATWIIANGPPGNHILRTNMPATSIDERIDELLGTISRRTGGIRWLLFPADRPTDLRDRLTRRGLSTDRGDHWMFRPTDRVPMQLPSCRIRPVKDRVGLRAWWKASALGFGTTQRATQPWYDAYRRHSFGRNAYAINYTGQVDQMTVTSATLVLAGGIAGIYDVSTPPRFRGRGYAKALTSYLLEQARQEGFSFAGLQTADALQFYQQLGFETGYQEEEFFWAAGEQDV